jgi:hypothetical protein
MNQEKNKHHKKRGVYFTCDVKVKKRAYLFLDRLTGLAELTKMSRPEASMGCVPAMGE